MTILKDGVQKKLIVKGTQQFRFFMTKKDGASAVVAFSEPVTLENAIKVLKSVGAEDAIYLDCGGNESGAFWDEKRKKYPLGENGAGHYDNLLVIHVPGK